MTRPNPIQRLPVCVILEAVSNYYAVQDITAPRRNWYLNHARQVAMYLLCKYTLLTMEGIAAAVGRTNHTTVVHGRMRISTAIRGQEGVEVEVEEIERAICEGEDIPEGRGRKIRRHVISAINKGESRCESLLVTQNRRCHCEAKTSIWWDGREYMVCGYHKELQQFIPA